MCDARLIDCVQLRYVDEKLMSSRSFKGYSRKQAISVDGGFGVLLQSLRSLRVA